MFNTGWTTIVSSPTANVTNYLNVTGSYINATTGFDDWDLDWRALT